MIITEVENQPRVKARLNSKVHILHKAPPTSQKEIAFSPKT